MCVNDRMCVLTCQPQCCSCVNAGQLLRWLHQMYGYSTRPLCTSTLDLPATCPGPSALRSRRVPHLVCHTARAYCRHCAQAGFITIPKFLLTLSLFPCQTYNTDNDTVKRARQQHAVGPRNSRIERPAACGCGAEPALGVAQGAAGERDDGATLPSPFPSSCALATTQC